MPRELIAHTRVAGRYELVERLIDGPFGERWRAADSQGGEVRVTWLHGATVSEDLARGLPHFGHVGAVAVREMGSHDGGVYVVSALPAGRPLRAFLGALPSPAALPLKDVRALVDQVAQAMVAAHRGVDDRAIVHGGPVADCVWIDARGGSRLIATLDDFSLALLRGPSRRCADDVAELGRMLAVCLLGDGSVTPLRLDEAGRRARPDVHHSVWEIVRACIAPGEDAPVESATRFRDLLRRAQWTPQEVVVAPRRSAPEVSLLPSFERAPPTPAPAPTPTPTPTPALAPAPAPEPTVVPAQVPVPATAPRSRAQVGRRMGILSSGGRTADTAARRVRTATAYAHALPSTPMPAWALDTLKPQRSPSRPPASVQRSSEVATTSAPRHRTETAAIDLRHWESAQVGAETLRTSRAPSTPADVADAFSDELVTEHHAPVNAWVQETHAVEVAFAEPGLAPPPNVPVGAVVAASAAPRRRGWPWWIVAVLLVLGIAVAVGTR
jgi:hypothetical protein